MELYYESSNHTVLLHSTLMFTRRGHWSSGAIQTLFGNGRTRKLLLNTRQAILNTNLSANSFPINLVGHSGAAYRVEILVHVATSHGQHHHPHQISRPSFQILISSSLAFQPDSAMIYVAHKINPTTRTLMQTSELLDFQQVANKYASKHVRVRQT